ncbi:hypothetical protein C0431_15115 [bacterium]|nr:hypothetical protein [bacterium]
MITLIPETSQPEIDFIKTHANTSRFTICDFHPKNLENIATPTVYGWSYDGIDVVDHHAPDRRFQKPISSGPLAIEYLKHHSTAQEAIINHTDTDSIISSGIVTGLLPPLEVLADACIAADHTGEENEIADFIQELEDKRDFDLGINIISAFLDNKPLPQIALEAREIRKRQREIAFEFASNAKIQGPIASIVTTETIDSVLLVPFLPETQIIVLTMPFRGDSKRAEVKLRLGRQAHTEMSLQNLNIQRFLKTYGGRWNAGSNRRGGGIDLTPADAELFVVTNLLNQFA